MSERYASKITKQLQVAGQNAFSVALDPVPCLREIHVGAKWLVEMTNPDIIVNGFINSAFLIGNQDDEVNDEQDGQEGGWSD